MSATKIDLNQPIKIDMDDFSEADIEDFETENGGMDLVQFTDALKEGLINESNFLKNLKPFGTFLWICLRKQYPGTTREDVRQLGLGRMWKNFEVVTTGETVQETKPLQAMQRPQPAIRN